MNVQNDRHSTTNLTFGQVLSEKFTNTKKKEKYFDKQKKKEKLFEHIENRHYFCINVLHTKYSSEKK